MRIDLSIQNTIEDLKQSINQSKPTFLQLAKKSGYICPFCNNGAGADGDGLVPFKASNGRILYQCFKCDDGTYTTFTLFKGYKGYSAEEKIEGAKYISLVNEACELLGISSAGINTPNTTPNHSTYTISNTTRPKQKAYFGVNECNAEEVKLFEAGKEQRLRELYNRGESKWQSIPLFLQNFKYLRANENKQPLGKAGYRQWQNESNQFSFSEVKNDGGFIGVFISNGLFCIDFDNKEVNAERRQKLDGEYKKIINYYKNIVESEKGFYYIERSISYGYHFIGCFHNIEVKLPMIKLTDGTEHAKDSGIEFFTKNKYILLTGDIIACSSAEAISLDQSQLLINLYNELYTHYTPHTDEESIAEAEEVVPLMEKQPFYIPSADTICINQLAKQIGQPRPFKTQELQALNTFFRGGIRNYLYIIGALASAGKTALCISMALDFASQNIPILFFSIEMTSAELIGRVYSNLSFKLAEQQGKSTERALKDGYKYLIEGSYSFTDGYFFTSEDFFNLGMREALQMQGRTAQLQHLQEVEETFKKLYGKNLFIIQGSDLRDQSTNKQLEARSFEKVVSDYLNSLTAEGLPKPIIFIDYLQYLMLGDENPRRAGGEYLQVFKNIKERYSVPIILISSLNRDSYYGSINETSFKETGDIEYCADSLIGLQVRNMREIINHAYPEARSGGREARALKEFINEALGHQVEKRELEILMIKMRNGERNYFSLIDFTPRTQQLEAKEDILQNRGYTAEARKNALDMKNRMVKEVQLDFIDKKKGNKRVAELEEPIEEIEEVE